MIVALLSQHSNVVETTLAPYFASSSFRQGKLIALIEAHKGSSRHHARRHWRRLLSVIGLVRHTPDRAVVGLARDQDHSIIEEALHVAALPGTALVQRGSARFRHAAPSPRTRFSDTKGERS